MEGETYSSQALRKLAPGYEAKTYLTSCCIQLQS